MNAANFFNQIRQYINNNATHANDVARSDARTCGANNISVFAGNYEFAIESRCSGRGYVTVRRDQAIIANQSTLNYLFNADDAIGATLAILEKQDKQRGEDAIAFGDDVPLQMDVNDDRRAVSPIEKARQMIADGTASGRLVTEVASYERMAAIIESCNVEGREPGRNVCDAMMASEVNIKWEVAK
jgi:hypothetical protein